MKYLKQVTIIFAISFVAELLSALLPGKLPASVFGLILMFLLLYFKVLKVSQIKESVLFFIEIMPVIFIPAGVGLMAAWAQVEQNIVAIVTITVLSTISVIVVTGLTTQKIYEINMKKIKKQMLEERVEE